MALWPFGSKEKATLTPEQRTALTSVVRKSKFEIIPLKGIQEKSEALPAGATVTVTASPAKGMDATIELAEWLTRTGRNYDVIPHLSSKLVRDRAHLGELLTRIRAAGMKKVFVVGGDGDAIGTFKDGVDLVRAVAESGQPLDEIGVPAYPEGHSAIPNDALMRALKDKQPHAQTMATQMAFNPNEVGEWILKVRGEGVDAAALSGRSGRRRTDKADAHRDADRRRGLGALSVEEHRPARPHRVGRVVRTGRVPPVARAGHRGSRQQGSRPPRVHVQFHRHDRRLAEADARRARGVESLVR